MLSLSKIGLKPVEFLRRREGGGDPAGCMPLSFQDGRRNPNRPTNYRWEFLVLIRIPLYCMLMRLFPSTLSFVLTGLLMLCSCNYKDIFEGKNKQEQTVMEKRIINTTNAPAPIGPYSQAVLVNGVLYCSGQIAINPETNELVSHTLEDETHQVMRNIGALLKEAEMDFGNIVKTSIFLSDMSLFTEVNRIYANYFEKDFPARETVAVKGLPKGVNVEISVIAVR